MIVKGYCKTELDSLLGVRFPQEFAGVPQIGSWVRAVGSNKIKVRSIVTGEIVSVTFDQLVLRVREVVHFLNLRGEPEVKILLSDSPAPKAFGSEYVFLELPRCY